MSLDERLTELLGLVPPSEQRIRSVVQEIQALLAADARHDSDLHETEAARRDDGEMRWCPGCRLLLLSKRLLDSPEIGRIGRAWRVLRAIDEQAKEREKGFERAKRDAANPNIAVRLGRGRP